ncbi:MAG: hypothetical protein IPK78_06210, partial [Rhodospirillales bacterium]|nr:hypothetical protein [Rhodospirillales bacterium]
MSTHEGRAWPRQRTLPKIGTSNSEASSAPVLKKEKTFREAAKLFEREFELLTEDTSSPRHVESQKGRLRVHLIPFFGDR